MDIQDIYLPFLKNRVLYVDNPDPTLDFELFTIFDNELNAENSITIPSDKHTFLDNYIHINTITPISESLKHNECL